jgi:oxygen-independent coproporphyrinogen-3 oxidase
MVGTGVASFSHFAGVHYQNVDTWEDYVGRLEAGQLPIARALPVTSDARLIREMILQMKLGRLDRNYFRGKFGVDVMERFAAQFEGLRREGLAAPANGEVTLSREGLLRVDSLLPRFFEPQYANVRYT